MGVAATDDEILRDEQERSNLLRAIADGEAAIVASPPSTRRVLENMVENGKKRIVILDKKIEEAKIERQAEEQAKVAAAALAAKETKLSAEERETYRGFLEKSCFTKKDFGKLDEFYQHSYDRLSDGGKDEMSKRFWEGVKRGEYKFGDAPSVVQQKESERAKNNLGLNELRPEQLRVMSSDEQRAFADAYNSGDHAEAKQVLAHTSIGRERSNLDAAKVDRASEDKHSSAITSIDLSSVDLKNVQLADATPATSASIPDVSGARVNGR